MQSGSRLPNRCVRPRTQPSLSPFYSPASTVVISPAIVRPGLVRSTLALGAIGAPTHRSPQGTGAPVPEASNDPAIWPMLHRAGAAVPGGRELASLSSSPMNCGPLFPPAVRRSIAWPRLWPHTRCQRGAYVAQARSGYRFEAPGS